jgi:hypothetical protein
MRGLGTNSKAGQPMESRILRERRAQPERVQAKGTEFSYECGYQLANVLGLALTFHSFVESSWHRFFQCLSFAQDEPNSGSTREV